MIDDAKNKKAEHQLPQDAVSELDANPTLQTASSCSDLSIQTGKWQMETANKTMLNAVSTMPIASV